MTDPSAASSKWLPPCSFPDQSAGSCSSPVDPSSKSSFWRCLIGAAALGLLCLALGLFRQRLATGQIALAILGGVAIVSNWLLLFAAYEHASIAVATAVYNVQPFILLGFGVLSSASASRP